ncbi:hypothetical protein DRO53_04740 [Candidatus Bathyarchaeota archaeon]|nr:MAG: hypothetical protein DRO53_04740 [Candidatus Bathyarchaeota archaeon]
MSKVCVEDLLVKAFPSQPSSRILTDKGLAGLGDAYLNFAYSLARSLREGKPKSLRVANRVLMEAVRKAGLRRKLPSRLSRKDIGGAAEALLVYASARGFLPLGVLVERLAEAGSEEELVEALSGLLMEAARRLKI